MDKSPGVRPIGMGEKLKSEFGKAIGFVIGMNSEDVAVVSQLCAGIKEVIEGAVHTLNEMFEVNTNQR